MTTKASPPTVEQINDEQGEPVAWFTRGHHSTDVFLAALEHFDPHWAETYARLTFRSEQTSPSKPRPIQGWLKMVAGRYCEAQSRKDRGAFEATIVRISR